MEEAIKLISPQSIPGSLLSSLAVHGIIAASVVGILSLGAIRSEVAPSVVTLDYEMLEAPPVAKAIQQMARLRAAETPVRQEMKSESVAHELQDEKSDVAGKQAALKADTAVGAAQSGTADAAPFYKVKPKYPRAALVAGEEGWILLKIDVSESGGVENVRVIDGVKRNLFQDEAKRAVEKWKYKPFLDSKGAPVRKVDHQVRVEFKLQDA